MTNLDTFSLDTSVRERLKADLKTALKNRQAHIATTLRSALAELDNAEAIELDASMVAVVGQFNDRPRKTLTEAQMQDILRKEANTLQDALEEYKRLGKHEEVEQLQLEWEVLVQYL